MTAIIARKTLRGLEPADDMARERLAKIKLGETVAVDVRRPRNLKHMRLWWALMQVVAENIDGDVSAEVVCDVVKLRIGHVNTVNTAKGLVHTPKSISFSSMDQTAFNEFFDRAVSYICREVLPGLGSDELRNEVISMIGGEQ